jgi:hypothetical protein
MELCANEQQEITSFLCDVADLFNLLLTSKSLSEATRKGVIVLSFMRTPIKRWTTFQKLRPFIDQFQRLDHVEFPLNLQLSEAASAQLLWNIRVRKLTISGLDFSKARAILPIPTITELTIIDGAVDWDKLYRMFPRLIKLTICMGAIPEMVLMEGKKFLHQIEIHIITKTDKSFEQNYVKGLEEILHITGKDFNPPIMIKSAPSNSLIELVEWYAKFSEDNKEYTQLHDSLKDVWPKQRKKQYNNGISKFDMVRTKVNWLNQVIRALTPIQRSDKDFKLVENEIQNDWKDAGVPHEKNQTTNRNLKRKLKEQKKEPKRRRTH